MAKASATTLTLITAEEAEVTPELQPGESVPHGFGGWTRRKVTAQKQVSLADVKGQLDAIQGELDVLLQSLPEPKGGPFRLSEVEVGLSITAEGSIGIATVGGEVSLALKFARGD